MAILNKKQLPRVKVQKLDIVTTVLKAHKSGTQRLRFMLNILCLN